MLAVSLEPDDASTTLFFGNLVERLAGTLRVVRYGHATLAQELAGAGAVILVRGLFEMAPVVWSARALGIPLYYFADDNFMLLREEPGAWSPFVERYSVVNVRARLRSFAGVLLSSEALIERFRRDGLHAVLMAFPPVGWPQPLPPAGARRGTIGIGFFGGAHLHDMFRACILPAIRRLAEAQPVDLVAAGIGSAIAASPGLSVVNHEHDRSYARGLRRLAGAGIDILVHPALANLQNNEFKNPHALISAHAIGAVPVVSDRAPYDALRSAGVTIQSDDSVESWYAALKHASDPLVRAIIRERLGAYCAAHFAGRVNRAVLERLLGGPPQRALPAFAGRQIVRALLIVNRVWRGVTSSSRPWRPRAVSR